MLYEVITTSLESNIQKMMDEKGIKILAKIPGDTPALPKISYRFVDGDHNDRMINLESPVDSKLIFTSKELVNALKGSIPDIGDRITSYNVCYTKLLRTQVLQIGSAQPFVCWI